MNNRDRQIIRKILKYCDEIDKTHAFFNHDSDLFKKEKNRFHYQKKKLKNVQGRKNRPQD